MRLYVSELKAICCNKNSEYTKADLDGALRKFARKCCLGNHTSGCCFFDNLFEAATTLQEALGGIHQFTYGDSPET